MKKMLRSFFYDFMKDKIALIATYRKIFAIFFMSMYGYKTEKIIFFFLIHSHGEKLDKVFTELT